ncbi:restriction endonuclease subunit S [Litoribacter alkaliphilus]|uniref:Restriction endonuclease subunit S n=1 Tax=Litoribacter ruber TaxID=702568 RepID=A0AAP2G2C1_9BACT|nr:restriction endonuclease subunit S [Litoribacter alkaliphilus]MBS9525934.1 restriction endonuclease subunit S [Litoribacter alkaliphilus]
MREDYKRLGKYIRKIDVRNKEEKDFPLLGVSVAKVFIPSIANTVGTDFGKYKIVKRNQFTYIPDTSRRGDKIGLALLENYDAALVSQAYTIFEITDHEELLPEYLMMWFKRPEFDRYARFISHGSVREIFDWDDMCDVMLPVPSLEQQREIVAEYQAIEKRIQLNDQLILKLEDTAQTIYRRWFVEGVNSENLPEGWELNRFTDVVKLGGGGTPDTNNQSFWNGEIPFFTPADIGNHYYSTKTLKSITHEGLNNSSTKLYPKDTIFVTARGTVGAVTIAGSSMTMNQSCYSISGKNPFYLHQLALQTMQNLKKEAVGAVFGALVTKDFENQLIIDPPEKLKNKYNNEVSSLYKFILLKTCENHKLDELKLLTMSKLAQNEPSILKECYDI